ncbi:MAG: HAD family phosphatase [Verrucomicrobia bacterium]|jgi:putative hydrolase of the HAD superfamily|nr:HAD family phosphatase [Verrucomicrobiota bacterium]
MNAPKAVVFDLGKVLLDFDYSIAARRMAARSQVSPRHIQDFIDHSPLLVRYEKGQLTRQEFFQEVRGLTGYRGTLDDFSRLFSDVFTPILPMIAFKERLSAAGIPTYIFSNTNDLAITHISASYPFYRGFDGYVLSYEHGFMKPEPELYERIEALTRCTGGEILYFDDRAENVQGGLQRGWRAVHHQAPDASVQAATRAGLLG